MKHKERRENKSKKLLISIIIVIILVFSTFAIILSGYNEEENTNSYKSNGIEFTKSDSGWFTQIQGNYVVFDYSIEDVRNISLISPSITDRAYIAYDPKERDDSMDYSISKLYRTLKVLGYNAYLACIKEEGCPDIPVVSCEENKVIFLLRKADNSLLYKDGNCIVIGGDSVYFSRAVDRIDYGLVGAL